MSTQPRPDRSDSEIHNVVAACKGSYAAAARELGMPSSTVRGACARHRVAASGGTPMQKKHAEQFRRVTIVDGPAVGSRVTVVRGDDHRFAVVDAIDGDEIAVLHRGLRSAFSRVSGECIESEKGCMRGFVLERTSAT